VHEVPKRIDEEIAGLKLASLDVEIDALDERQAEYLSSWGQR
jgi:adenosylhomocysteinase